MQNESCSTTSATADSVAAPVSPPAAGGKYQVTRRWRCRRLENVRDLAGGLFAGLVLWCVSFCQDLAVAAPPASAEPQQAVGPRQYTAVALLLVSAKPQHLVFQTADHESEGSFEMYKRTQQQLLTSDITLIAALRTRITASLAVVQKEDDQVRWLAKNLRVDFPGNAEIMRVRLTTSRPDEAAVLVGAVVDAYMSEVVDAERRRQRDRLNVLDHLFTEREIELRSLRTEFKQLAEQLGTGDSGGLALKKQIALQTYAELRNEFSRLHSELQRVRDKLIIKVRCLDVLDADELQIKQALLKAVDASEPELKDSDPVLTKLQEQFNELGTRLSEAEAEAAAGIKRDDVKKPTTARASHEEGATTPLVKPIDAKSQISELASARKVIEGKLAERHRVLDAFWKKLSQRNLELVELKARKELLDASREFKAQKKSQINQEVDELKTRIEILTRQEIEAAKDLEKQRQKAELFGNSSIDVDMLRDEIKYREEVLRPIAVDREKLKVELRCPPRISIFQKAEAPKSPDP